MVRPGSVVTGAFRRIGSHKDTACILYLSGNISIVGRLDNQMFRCVQVGEVDHFLFILQHDKTAVAQRFFRDLLTRQPVQLFPDRLHDRFDDAFGCRHQHGLAVHAMFRLGKEIGGDKSRIGRFIRYHFHFGRTGRHVDSHLFQADQLFGRCHILVTGTEYLIDLRNRFRSISHRRYSLDSPGLEYFADTCRFRCKEDGRVYLPFPVRRRTKHDFLTAGNMCRDSQHQDGREKRSRSAGNIQTDLFYRDRFLPAGDTRCRLHLLPRKTL